MNKTSFKVFFLRLLFYCLIIASLVMVYKPFARKSEKVSSKVEFIYQQF